MASATVAGGGQDFDGGEDMPYVHSTAAGIIYGDVSDNDSTSAYSIDDNKISEPQLSMEQRMRLPKLWVVNPSSSHEWTHGIDDVL
ncbi:hypothetical protein D1007_52659 [Hordeum vulgare]|nr:hypothetical protein D1007_52659 [Hordeum vulgare]